MTQQLTKAQIDAIKVELAKVGLVVTEPGTYRKVKPRIAKATGDELAERIARVQAMKFKTAGIKSRILNSLKLSQRCRDYRAANPFDVSALLGMFGIRLQSVNPWPAGEGFDQRWQMLRNGCKPCLALPAPRASWPHYVGSAFPSSKRIEVEHGLATLKQINQA